MKIQPDSTVLSPPEFHWPLPPRTKWEREYRAFHRLLPQLLATQRGQFVAIHEERVIDSDADELMARVAGEWAASFSCNGTRPSSWRVR